VATVRDSIDLWIEAEGYDPARLDRVLGDRQIQLKKRAKR
jgi:hypothetical protein